MNWQSNENPMLASRYSGAEDMIGRSVKGGREYRQLNNSRRDDRHRPEQPINRRIKDKQNPWSDLNWDD